VRLCQIFPRGRVTATPSGVPSHCHTVTRRVWLNSTKWVGDQVAVVDRFPYFLLITLTLASFSPSLLLKVDESDDLSMRLTVISARLCCCSISRSIGVSGPFSGRFRLFNDIRIVLLLFVGFCCQTPIYPMAIMRYYDALHSKLTLKALPQSTLK